MSVIVQAVNEFLERVKFFKLDGYHIEYGYDAFMTDIATMRINLGRQAGHTSAVAKMYKPKDFIISQDIDNIRDMIFGMDRPRMNQTIMNHNALQRLVKTNLCAYRGTRKLYEDSVIYAECYNNEELINAVLSFRAQIFVSLKVIIPVVIIG